MKPERRACPSARPLVRAGHGWATSAAGAFPVVLPPCPSPRPPRHPVSSTRACDGRIRPRKEAPERQGGEPNNQGVPLPHWEAGRGKTDTQSTASLSHARGRCGRDDALSTPTQRRKLRRRVFAPGTGHGERDTGRNRQLLLEDPSGACDEQDRQSGPPPAGSDQGVRVPSPHRLAPSVLLPPCLPAAWAPARNGRICAGSSSLVSLGDSARGGRGEEYVRRSAPR